MHKRHPRVLENWCFLNGRNFLYTEDQDLENVIIVAEFDVELLQLLLR